jgi:hypothetical protein
VPAVRDLGRVLEVVPAVLALLLALRLCLEDRVVGEVPQLDRELLVDLLGSGSGISYSATAWTYPLLDG